MEPGRRYWKPPRGGTPLGFSSPGMTTSERLPRIPQEHVFAGFKGTPAAADLKRFKRARSPAWHPAVDSAYEQIDYPSQSVVFLG